MHHDATELAPACAETLSPGLHPAARVLAVIPHLACHDWLGAALESLLAQTRPPDAIVVVDDGSDDPPVDIVSAFPQVTLLHADENVGPYRLIQQVIDETDHDAYLFQDADDWSAPDRLERLLLASERTGAELVGSDYVLLDTRRWSARRVLFPVDANRALTDVPTGHAQQHPAGLVARSLVERVGGYATGMRFSGDDEFLRRAGHVAKVVNVPRALYYRRHRSQSLTTSAVTGHGSPARRAILTEMSDRALANAAAVAAGSAPDLTPLRTRGPVRLRHLAGPDLPQLCGNRIGFGTGSRGHEQGEAAGADRLEVPAPNAAQIVVVGAPGSGNDAVACSLAQHPAIAFAGDVSWVAEVGASIAGAAGTADAADVSVAGTRPGTQLDALAVVTDDVSRLVGPALDAVIIGGSTSGPAAPGDDAATLQEIARLPLTPARRWVGTLPPDRTALVGALRMFPDLHVVHVVRDVDEIAHLGDGDHTPEAATAAADWQAGTEVLLDLEQAVGPRVHRVRLRDVLADPHATLAGCLDALGEDHHPSVAHPFTPARPRDADPEPHPSVAASARRLSAALIGPVRAIVDLERLTAPEPMGAEDPGPQVTATATATAGAPPGRTGPGRRARQARPSGRAAPMRRRPPVHPSVPAAIELVDRHVPADATVAVVSRGDDALLRFRATGRHLPSAEDGRYAGHHPADDGAAILELDAARRAGAGFLLVPSTSDWWFDHYRGLTDRLARTARRVAEQDGHVLFELIAATATGRRRPSSGSKPRVHVVSWSVSHNPYGRAHLLADVLAETCDVEVVGATFEPFGGGIWQPLVGSRVPLRTFPGGRLPEMLPRMQEMAATLDGDAIYVSKPRFPGFGTAILAKLLHDRPLILDVDDHELAFVNATTGMSLDELRTISGSDALLNPYGGPWTRYCDHLIGEADARTVSNAVLQERYGGDVIGHVRDERTFDPSRWDRDDVRKTFGFDRDDRVVLFGGTPRRHKGIVEIAAALRRAGDPRLKLCLIETAELSELAADLGPYADLIHTVPYQPMEDLPALVVAADLVCVLQDPDSPVARFQIPAKITDALALGVPCLTILVPPLADLAATGALHVVDGPLHDAISAVFDDPRGAAERARIGREVFLEQLSYAAVRPRLTSIVEEQIANHTPASVEFGRAAAFAREVASGSAWAAAGDPAVRPVADGTATIPATYDVVMFWKQNDTGVYGRRHDMLLEQLARSPRVGRIVQFDHPIGIAELERLAAEPATSHGRLLHQQTAARRAGLDDDADGRVVRRTFVYENRAGDDPARCADEHPPRTAHVRFVRDVLAEAGVGAGDRPVILWGYPKHLDLTELIEALSPDLVVMDVVDDHRTWRSDRLEQDEIADHYADVLARADLTFTNCAPMEAEVQPWARRVHLVPNGCQWPPAPVTGPPPDELAGMEGPIIGYVGNLSSRIDVDLLEHVARQRPSWNLVLVGSTHAGRAALDLDVHPNVHFVGPQRIDDARRFIECFDVAIIPHVDDHMTRKMHPLKAFVYCTAGVPVVSTAIDNLDELRGLVRVADDADGFITEIEAALVDGRRPLTDEAREVLAAHAWTVRMAEIERLIDSAWEHR